MKGDVPMKRSMSVLSCFMLGFLVMFGCGGGSDGDGGNDNILDPNSGDEGSGYSVSGRCLTADGDPIPGVDVGVFNNDTQIVTVTDNNGNFTLKNVPNGSYGLTPSKVDYVFEPEYRVVTVNGKNITSQNFTGTTDGGGDIPGTITVTIGDGLTPEISWDGGNVNTIIVMDTTAWGSNYQWKISSPENAVNSIGSPVTYGVAPSGVTEEVNKPLEPGHEYRVTISRWSNSGNIVGYGYFDTEGEEPVGDGYQVTGAVVDGDRHGIEGALVVIASGDSVTLMKTETTDSGGVYTFNNIPDGVYTIVATHPSYNFDPVMQEITVSGENKAVSNFVAK